MKFKYWSVCVFFRYTSNLTFPSSFLINRVSTNGICPSVFSSYVNRMLPVESTEFRCSVSCVTLPLFITSNVSSTNLFHSLGLRWCVARVIGEHHKGV